jgi:hypothetical protein
MNENANAIAAKPREAIENAARDIIRGALRIEVSTSSPDLQAGNFLDGRTTTRRITFTEGSRSSREIGEALHSSETIRPPASSEAVCPT